MKSYEGLWELPERDESLQLTDNVVPFMQSQCDAIEQKSGGKIKARFFETVAANEVLVDIAKRAPSSSIQVMSNKKNATELYAAKNYQFEIESGEYSYRVFSMQLPAAYPAKIRFDEDLLSRQYLDTKSAVGKMVSGWLVVDGDAELHELFGMAVRSRKMIVILYKLLYEITDSEMKG